MWLLAQSLGGGELPTWSSSFVAMEIGRSISRSEALFLTLETNTLGFKALTFVVKSHLLSSSHAVHAAFSVGVYINLLNSYIHSKDVSWNHKYMYTNTYMNIC